MNEYDRMEQIRAKQQKLYEEQALRHAQEKQKVCLSNSVLFQFSF